MGTLAIIKIIITYLPDLLELIKKIGAWIQAGVDDAEIKRRLQSFGQAEDDAKATKDTSALENQFHNPPPPPPAH